MVYSFNDAGAAGAPHCAEMFCNRGITTGWSAVTKHRTP